MSLATQVEDYYNDGIDIQSQKTNEEQLDNEEYGDVDVCFGKQRRGVTDTCCFYDDIDIDDEEVLNWGNDAEDVIGVGAKSCFWDNMK